MWIIKYKNITETPEWKKSEHESYCQGISCNMKWNGGCAIYKIYDKASREHHKYLCKGYERHLGIYPCQETYCPKSRNYKYWGWFFKIFSHECKEQR